MLLNVKNMSYDLKCLISVLSGLKKMDQLIKNTLQSQQRAQ